MSTLAKKLLLKPAARMLMLEAPPGAETLLEPLPAGVHVGTEAEGVYDLVLAFARDQAALARLAPTVLSALKPAGILWVGFPKGSSKIQTDLSRDKGWDPLTAAGFVGVALFSWDDTWTCFRLRPQSEVARK